VCQDINGRCGHGRPRSKIEQQLFCNSLLGAAKKNESKFFIRRFHNLGAEHVNIKDSAGNSPLYYACLHGHCSIVRLLLKLGADINASNERGNTALHAAFKIDHPEVDPSPILSRLLESCSPMGPTTVWSITPMKRPYSTPAPTPPNASASPLTLSTTAVSKIGARSPVGKRRP
jgi:hypothetical protein